MTVKDLIKNKDYDYISFRCTAPWAPIKGEFFGACKSKNGKLIPLDGDIYYDDIELVSWEEFGCEFGIGLEVIEPGEWIEN